MQSRQTIPLALYIHLPWCIRKCPYCDFNSYAAGSGGVRDGEYVEALIRDLEFELPRIWGRRIISLFIGGGTPSLFSAESLERLLSSIHARLNFSSGIEITLEVNPGTAETGKFSDYRQIGINRLAIGVQSFDDEKLRGIGRIHTGAEAIRAIGMAREAGFENINLDLMFGLPGQSADDALTDLQTAMEQSPTHISWYQLTIEPGTAFAARPPVLPDDDRIWNMQRQGQALLAKRGYRQYEISAYARDRRDCIHNRNYWEFGDYLGLGAGAHGKLTDTACAGIQRYARQRVPENYLRSAGSEQVISGTRSLSQGDIVLEFMMNALRLNAGIPVALFQERTGLNLAVIEAPLGQAQTRGLLQCNRKTLKPTAKGLRYLNDLLELFMPAGDGHRVH